MDPIARHARLGLDFRGRATRRSFWRWTLVALIVGVIALAVDQRLGLAFGRDGPRFVPPSGPLSVGAALLLSVPSVSIAVRRLHDVDRRGWWLLMPAGSFFGVFASLVILSFWTTPPDALVVAMLFTPLAAGALLAVWLFGRGTAGPNRFGPDPKDPMSIADLAEVFR